MGNVLSNLFRWFKSPGKKSFLDDALRGGGAGVSYDDWLAKVGRGVTPETAMRCVTVYACVRVIAESIAQLPLITYRRENGKKSRASDHWAYRLLHDKPNEYQTAFEFWEMIAGHVLLRGNAYAVKAKIGDEVKALYPLHPDAVTVKKVGTNLIYEVRATSGGDVMTYPADRILHFKGMSADGYTGTTPITYARNAIGLSVAMERHGAALFSNGARPGGVLKHPGQLGEEAAKRLADDWDATFGGGGIGKTAVLEEGMEWLQLGMTSTDAQFLELRKYTRSEIAGIFRVPPHKIGDLERATFSNIEHQSLEFVTNTLLPWLRRFEQTLRAGLFGSEPDVYAEFLVDGLLRGDAKTRYSTYQIGINAGILSPNECRERENMNPREGGDEYLRPLNMSPDGTGQTSGEEDDDEGENSQDDDTGE